MSRFTGEWCYFTVVVQGKATRLLCPDRPDAAWVKSQLRERGYECSATEDGMPARTASEAFRAAELRSSLLSD